MVCKYTTRVPAALRAGLSQPAKAPGWCMPTMALGPTQPHGPMLTKAWLMPWQPPSQRTTCQALASRKGVEHASINAPHVCGQSKPCSCRQTCRYILLAGYLGLVMHQIVYCDS